MVKVILDSDYAQADAVLSKPNLSYVRDMIAGSIAAERERCAKIADQLARSNEILNGGKDAPGAIAAARAIAALIRNKE